MFFKNVLDTLYSLMLLQGTVLTITNIISTVSFSGYLGYTSGFSLSCMVFFLVSVSPLIMNSTYVYCTSHMLSPVPGLCHAD